MRGIGVISSIALLAGACGHHEDRTPEPDRRAEVGSAKAGSAKTGSDTTWEQWSVVATIPTMVAFASNETIVVVDAHGAVRYRGKLGKRRVASGWQLSERGLVWQETNLVDAGGGVVRAVTFDGSAPRDTIDSPFQRETRILLTATSVLVLDAQTLLSTDPRDGTKATLSTSVSSYADSSDGATWLDAEGLHFYDVASRTERWRAKPLPKDATIRGVASGVVVSTGQETIEYDLATGTLAHKEPLAGPTRGVVASIDTHELLVLEGEPPHAQLALRDRANRNRWRVALPSWLDELHVSRTERPTAFANDQTIVFAGAATRRDVVALDRQNGTTRFTRPQGKRDSLIGVTSHCIVITTSAKLECVDPMAGKNLWARPLVGEGGVVWLSGDSVVVANGDAILKLRSKDGVPEWQATPPFEIAHVDDDLVLVADKSKPADSVGSRNTSTWNVILRKADDGHTQATLLDLATGALSKLTL